MKGISQVITYRGISVGTWVSLDSDCEIKPEVFGEQLQIEFGPRTGSLGLTITEEMVDKLALVLADAKARFRELDAQAEQEELMTA